MLQSSGTSPFTPSFHNLSCTNITTISSTPLSCSIYRSKSHFPCFSVLNPNNTFSHSFSFSICFDQRRNGFSSFASSKRKQKNLSIDMEDDDEEEEGWGDGMPFDEMRKWLRNKPSGFGEGKMYDTTIEDKLLGEIEQSRKVQLANIDKLKNNPPEATLQHNKEQKEPKVAPDRIHVRLGNLPKKRNIHRDLRTAFKDFPGIIDIIPAVSGNKKTREPVCIGFASVTFKSWDSAHRFVQMYSQQSILFGKIQKQITFDIKNKQLSSDLAVQEEVDSVMHKHGVNVLSDSTTSDPEHNFDNVSMDSVEGSDFNEFNGDEADKSIKPISDMHGLLLNSDGNRVMNSKSAGGSNDIDGKERQEVVMIGNETLSSKTKQRSKAIQKKKMDGKKSEKVRLNIPGSALRLKIKDRSVLTGVLSKYGEKVLSSP